MVNLTDAWEIIYEKAKELLHTRAPYHNLRAGKTYRIHSVSREKIVIETDGKNKSFGRRSLLNQLRKLNEAGGIISYSNFFGNVARETTVVFLHPQLGWDNDGKNIVDMNA